MCRSAGSADWAHLAPNPVLDRALESGGSAVRLAVILACAGLALSLWLLGVLGRRFAEMNAAQ